MPDFDENDDIATDIRAAFDKAAEPAESAAVEAPALAKAVEETPAQAEARQRDEKGRFAPKAETETKTATTPSQTTEKSVSEAPAVEAATTAAEAKPLAPPKSWSPDQKAAFVSLPRPMQEEILRHEGTVQEAKQTWETKAERLNRLDEVLKPHQARWARDGVPESQAINQLLAAQDYLEKNPADGMAFLAKSFGNGEPVRLLAAVAAKFGLVLGRAQQGDGRQPQQGAPQGGPTQVDPTVQALQQQVTQLTQKLTQREQAENTTRQQSLFQEIAAFSDQPDHMYYENVKPQMAALLRIGDQSGDGRPIQERLKEAYDNACYANPAVRALIQKAASDKAAKVAEAKRASGSITGTATHGATYVNGNAIDDLDADIRAAMQGSARV